MNYLLILRGAPASGKSTYAREWVLAEENRIRINRDDIRLTHFGSYTGVDEQAVTLIEDALLVAAMKAHKDIVLDATNLNNKFLRGKIKLAQKWGYGVQYKDFDVTRGEAKRRDANREKRVGNKVIDSFFDRYKLDRSFPPFPEVPAPVTFPKYVPDDSKPDAIIVDLDGTLAIHADRNCPVHGY